MYYCFDRWDVGGCIGGWPFIGTLSASNSAKFERVWVCSLTCCTSLPFYNYLSYIDIHCPKSFSLFNLHLALSLPLGWGSAIQACQQGLQWTLALQLLNLATRSSAAFDAIGMSSTVVACDLAKSTLQESFTGGILMGNQNPIWRLGILSAHTN